MQVGIFVCYGDIKECDLGVEGGHSVKGRLDSFACLLID